MKKEVEHMPLIENPGKDRYVERTSSNVRFDPKIKEKLDEFLEENNLTLAGYINDLVYEDLKKRGIIKDESNSD